MNNLNNLQVMIISKALKTNNVITVEEVAKAAFVPKAMILDAMKKGDEILNFVLKATKESSVFEINKAALNLYKGA